jgi:tRNA (guanine37-N1)-methyltransferase
VRIDIVTLFPGMVEPALSDSIVGRARMRGIVDIRVHNLRDWAEGRHRVTDDTPFGGGGGMIMKPEPLARCVESLRAPGARVILLDPAGRRFTQVVARELAEVPHLVLLCGRYEGVDERVRESVATEEVSLGDFVLTGGEVAALAVIESTVRLLPGALGDQGSAEADSFSDGILDFPHYTRPAEARGMAVPHVLLSGDHDRIRRWRRKEALRATRERRPDLLEKAPLTPEDQALLREIETEDEGKGEPVSAQPTNRGMRQ